MPFLQWRKHSDGTPVAKHPVLAEERRLGKADGFSKHYAFSGDNDHICEVEDQDWDYLQAMNPDTADGFKVVEGPPEPRVRAARRAAGEVQQAAVSTDAATPKTPLGAGAPASGGRGAR